MYLTPTSKYWAIDIEGDLIPSTEFYCACVENVTTGEKLSFTGSEDLAKWLNERLKEGCKFIGHNIIGYDAPTLNRLLGTKLRITDVIDTMMLSQLYNPSLPGGHSLNSWGQRLKYPKIEFNDFSKFTPEMLTYCEQDTSLCKRIYIALGKRLKSLGFSDQGIELEHRAWQLVQQQRKNGFAFDIKEAHILYAKLREIENEIRDEILQLWPPTLEQVATYRRPYRKDGNPSANFSRHCEQFERVDVHPDREGYDCFDYVAFRVGSPNQRVEKLLELGWKPLPTELTKTGQPQPTKKGKIVPSLEEFVKRSQHKGPLLIARWMDINARGNAVNTWIEAYNEDTGCIHGSLWLANTHRYKHSGPNTANIPAVREGPDGKPLMGLAGVYTYESRGLWVTRDPIKRRLVGVDAKGIQLRVLAHYLNNPGFTKNILSSDPHSANQALFGLPSRALTKTITYATLMGAGDARIAAEARVPLKEAKATKAKFFDQLPQLPRLIGRLQAEAERTGRITLCDGSKIVISSPHTVIPFLLQGDESKIMKKTLILLEQEARKKGLDWLQVGFIHDEYQFDVLEEHVEEFVVTVLRCFEEAGKYFKYNIPIEGDAKVGLKWSDTH